MDIVRSIDNTRLPNNPIILEYFKIIAKLTVNVCNKQITYEYEDSLYSQETVAANKDDDSDSEQEPNPTSVREQTLLTRCIELLNEPERCVMTTCSQIKEADLSEEFLDCVSEICHNLLLSHRMALHKYRLVQFFSVIVYALCKIAVKNVFSAIVCGPIFSYLCQKKISLEA